MTESVKMVTQEEHDKFCTFARNHVAAGKAVPEVRHETVAKLRMLLAGTGKPEWMDEYREILNLILARSDSKPFEVGGKRSENLADSVRRAVDKAEKD